MNLIDVLFQIYESSQNKDKGNHLVYNIGISILMQVLISAHYYFARKYLLINQLFGFVQTCLTTVGILEKALLSYSPDFQSFDALYFHFVVLLVLSLTTYCQKCYLIALIATLIYTSLRFYFAC